MRSSRSARSTARRAPPTRPMPRSSGRTTPSRLWNRVFRTLATPAPGHRRQRPAVRDGGPGRRGRRDRLLEQQVPLEHLAPDHRHPRGRHRRKPGDQGRPDLDAAVRSLDAGGHGRPRSSPLRSPNTRPATTAPAARSSGRCSTSSAPTGRLQRIQQQIRDHSHLPPTLRRARRRTSTPACGPGSTSAPPTSRVPSSARRSPRVRPRRGRLAPATSRLYGARQDRPRPGSGCQAARAARASPESSALGMNPRAPQLAAAASG